LNNIPQGLNAAQYIIFKLTSRIAENQRVITGLAIAAAFRWVRGSDSGAFGDAGRHAPAPYCLQVSLERVNERPGIWRPLFKKNTGLKRVIVMCFVAQGNETPKAGPAGIVFGELLYNNGNKELHLQELYSSARASRNSQKCFEIFLYEAFLLNSSS